MKAYRITVRKGRKIMARIPLARMGGMSERWVLLFKVDDKHRVVEQQLVFVHWEAGGCCIHGYTHYAILPTHL